MANSDTHNQPENTTSPTTSVQRENLWLLAAGVAYILLFAVFWPRSFASMDESTYVNMGYVLRQGTVYPDAVGVSVVNTYPMHGHMVSKYPLGMPALLSLVSLGGSSAIFATNLIVHLLVFYLVVLLLRQLAVPGFFALLYLLHPSAVIYSRSLMADPLSGLLLTLSFYAYTNRRFALCGLAVGFSVLTRTANALAFLIFIFGCLAEAQEANQGVSRSSRAASAVPLALGAVPGVAIALYYAVVVAGGQMATHTGTFALRYFPQMFPGYVIGLMLIYPGMLVAPAFYRGRGRIVMLLLCYSFIVLYSFWYYRDQGSSALETLIVGQRYFLAVLPLFVVAYSAIIWQFVRVWAQSTRLVVGLGVTGLLGCMAVGIHHRHAQYTTKLATVRDSVLQVVAPTDTLFCNTTVGKLMYPGHTVAHINILGGEQTPENVAASTLAVQQALQTAQQQTAQQQTAQQQTAQPQAAPPTTASQPHVYLIYWVRANRADDAAEGKLLDEVAGKFQTSPPTARQQAQLPAEVRLMQVVGKRTASVKRPAAGI